MHRVEGGTNPFGRFRGCPLPHVDVLAMPAVCPGFSLDPPKNVLGGGVVEIRIYDFHQMRQSGSWEALASIKEDDGLVFRLLHRGFRERDRRRTVARDDGKDVAWPDPTTAGDEHWRAVISQQMRKNDRDAAPVRYPIIDHADHDAHHGQSPAEDRGQGLGEEVGHPGDRYRRRGNGPY